MHWPSGQLTNTDNVNNASLTLYHKVPESTHPETSSRQKDDLTFIYNLAKELGIEHMEVVNAIHLGCPVESRSRLSKVEVNSSQVKRQLFSKAKNLRQAKSDQLHSVFITPDLSPQERQQQKNLRVELHRHRNADKQNLVIRKGKIVSVQTRAMDTIPTTTNTAPAATTTTSASIDQTG